MHYEESEMMEMKNFLHDDMKTEIIAFLNSYSRGTIYVGVNDDGSVSSFSTPGKRVHGIKGYQLGQRCEV